MNEIVYYKLKLDRIYYKLTFINIVIHYNKMSRITKHSWLKVTFTAQGIRT